MSDELFSKNKGINLDGDEGEPEFQVAPMVDVLLVLLLFFMATATTEVIQQQADLELPKAAEAKEKEQGAGELVINIVKLTNSITMQDVVYDNPQDLVPFIQQAAQAAAQLNPGAQNAFHVLIRADMNTPFEKVGDVMKACAAAGVLDVQFAVTEDKEAVNRAANQGK